MTQETQDQRADGVDAPGVIQVQEELFLVLGEVGWDAAEELGAEGFVEGSGGNGEGQSFDHILHEAKIIHFVEDGGKLHENLLRLDAIAEIGNNLVQFVLVDLLLGVVESLDQPSHDLPEVLFVFGAEHADQIYDLLNKLWKLEVNRADERQKDVLVVVNEFVVEVFEKHDVPVHDDFLGGRMALVLLQKTQIKLQQRQSTYNWVFVNFELILKFLEYIFEVALFLHDFQHQL